VGWARGACPLVVCAEQWAACRRRVGWVGGKTDGGRCGDER